MRATQRMIMISTPFIISKWAITAFATIACSVLPVTLFGQSPSTTSPPSQSPPEELKLIATGEHWSQWRGAAGDGHTSGLPSVWKEPEKLWRYELPAQGIGGVAATEEFVVVSSRDANDQADLFAMLDAESGVPIWQFSYPSPLQLDYGNSPRVTPLITDTAVYCLGAQGQLHCLALETGEVLWKKDLAGDLKGRMPQWGYAASPKLVNNQLIVQTGGLEAAWTSLEPDTGKVIWTTVGRASAYASPILLEHRGNMQIVSYDAISLGAWSVENGKRLWEMQPEVPKDFNVPTPVLVKNKIFVVTENNGARTYSLHPSTSGEFPFELQLESSTDLLSGDSHSPVRVGTNVAGIDRDLVVLNPDNQLNEVARFSDPALQKYCSLLVDEDRIWICTANGTQILVGVQNDSIVEIGRFQSMNESGEIFAHPAICNGVLYLRGPTWIDAYRL